MKRLNTEEISEVAESLSMTYQEAEEVVNIFVNIYEKEQNGKRGWKIYTQLNSAGDYIKEWEDHWHRETNWNEFYFYEKENCYSDYRDAEEIFRNIDSFKEYIQQCGCAYELKCNGMIIIIC